MVYNDSDALRQEYQKVGEVYEESASDKHYKHVLKQIEQDPNKKEVIQSMTRLMVSPGEEYITYHHTWEGHNALGSFLRTAQTNVGVYPHFEPTYERFLNEDNTYGQRLLSKNTSDSYFIPFTKENAEKLHQICDDKTVRAKTLYYVQPEGGTPIVVESYNDWINGSFEDLHEHGKITKSLTNDDSNKRETPRQR